ncbi:MAG: PspC domain-containing protein [candidate division Zixibacteria bacterium]|nr:PspC domain-containing protein [candidate division Zixibacteria bacterium]
MKKKLYRSSEQYILGGVCGGIAEYFDTSPTLVRIITIILSVLPGVGLISYIIAWIVIPRRL